MAGIAVLLLWSGLHALWIHRAGARAVLPTSVGRTPVRIAHARGYAALTFAVALALPVGALAALLALVEWAWLPVAFVLVLVLGGVCAMVAAVQAREDARRRWPERPEAAYEVLRRLCMRADMTVPELLEEASATPNAWTSGGASTSRPPCCSCSTVMSWRPCSRTRSPTSPVAMRR